MGKRPQQKAATNIWDVFNSIVKLLSKALDRGSIVPTGLVIIAIVMSIRIPAEELLPVMLKVVSMFSDRYILGWSAMGVSNVGWCVFYRHVRIKHSEELERVGKVKSDYQEQAIGKTLPSSDKG